jgi:hypothetical protein
LSSSVFTSLFILGSSGVLLLFWLHAASRSLRRGGFEQDYAAEVSRAVYLKYESLRRALRSGAGRPAAVRAEALDWLERDYQALQYLLRRTAAAAPGPDAHSLALLRFDFQLLRLWVRVLGVFSAAAWRCGLVEMIGTLDYFGNVVGQRLQGSMRLFAPAWLGPGGGPLLSMCSYCRHVRVAREGSGERWVSAQQYQQAGGPTAVVLSHGICPDCYEHLIKPTRGRRQATGG